MAVSTSLAAFSAAERQLLRSQRLRSGQCVRCFHASLRKAVQDGTSGQDGNEIHKPAPSNKANRRLSNKERAARISNEVSMLQRVPPPGEQTDGPGSIRGTIQRDPEPPTTSAGFTKTPGSMGGERMGENISAGREGPNAQGVGRVAGADENVRNEHPSSRSMRNPYQVQEPSEGGVSVLEATTPGPPSTAARAATLEGKDTVSAIAESFNAGQERSLRDRLAKAKAQGLSFRPQVPSREHLLHTGSSAATPASKDFESVVLDRYKTGRSPVQALTVQKGEKARTLLDQNLLLQKLVAGRYPASWLSTENGRYKQKTLNQVMTKLAMNGTYLLKDADKLIEKVRPLLPATMQALRPVQGAAKTKVQTRA
ncbi:hypothetical protein AC579_1425 [Pseudocercospora musae]|uniref:Uncharacterized protein n=1 Tax=Pseudocercospora musae TaxID=113226 RepID=A0A139IMS3_9PEZI|nr:hypothetical protein AC579_1425 [Pseudocercospora musae]KXT15958.1 hypothetical protein AC579_1425 [Pseudocercospora musae]KXT15960.1 hypothetical protein AC579_1425 [Pseudocercospora musae]